MSVTRRRFHGQLVKTSLAGAAVAALGCTRSTSDDQAIDDSSTAEQLACNFQSSYMTWDLPPRPDPRPYARHNIPLGNKARIQLEAVIDVIDEDSDGVEQFVLIAACRTEWVYAETGLFQTPSREYRNIYSLAEQRGMGRAITYQGEPNPSPTPSDRLRSTSLASRPRVFSTRRQRSTTRPRTTFRWSGAQRFTSPPTASVMSSNTRSRR